MTIAILSGPERWLLAGAVLGFGLLALLLARRGARSAAVAAIIAAAMAGGALVTEQAVALAVMLAAPRAADFNEFRWVMLSPWGRIGMTLGIAAVVAIVALAWWANRRMVSPWRRAVLIGLRTAAALLALVLFVQPAIELRQVAREPNRIAVVVDESASMALREDARGPSRQQRVRALLDASASTFDRWEEAHVLDFYAFAEAATASSRSGVATTAPAGRATMIRATLEQVRARYAGLDLAGILLLSDGAATGALDEGDGDGALRDFLRSLDTRVHTVWTARRGLKDVATAGVRADELAFVRTVVRIEATLRATGYGARRVMVTLSSDGKPLRQKSVEIPADGEATVSFEVTPPRVGKYVYEIATPVADDEAVADNNARAFVLRVIRDKIRVLQVAGAPSWDVRALRSMLEDNPNVDLISFFILRTQDDITLVPNDEMSLIPFPTRELFEEQLPSFDLVVLQNFEYLPYGIGEYLENIRSYVEGGGGFVMLGGDLSFASGGYDDTPVAAALPVILPERWQAGPGPGGALLDESEFRPSLTEAGKVHPVTALRYELRDNLAAWAKLPALEGVNLVVDARPDATVLAAHPRLRTGSGQPMPVIIAGEYGTGRSLALTTDSLWRWGFGAAATPGDDGRHYVRFWENAIRWLIQDPDLRYLHIDSDAVEYAPGTPVRLTARLLDRDYTPLVGGQVSVVIRRGGDPTRTTDVDHQELTVGEAGVGTLELAGLEPGVYRVSATAKVAGKEAVASDIFLVREGSAELDEPAGNPELLRLIATTTGGRALQGAELDTLPVGLDFDPPRIVRVDRRTDVELWSRPGLLVLALLCLALEWLLRQRSGYL